MEQLPDDVLLEVMRHLDVPDLFACRLVSKRLGSLALHADVWRHRRFGSDYKHFGWQCTVLRLAPCLDALSVYAQVPTAETGCLQATTTTRCAVARLELSVFEGGAMLAAAIIRHQEALGRLRRLRIYFYEVSQAEGVALLATVVQTSGLTKLDLEEQPSCRSLVESMLRHTAVPVVSSLRSFRCSSFSTFTEHFVHFMLRVHAATLEEVFLDGRLLSTSTLTAPLLSGMPNLRQLKCTLVPELNALAACESLRVVSFTVRDEMRSAAAGRSALALLSHSTQLQEVELSFLHFTRSPEPDVLRFFGDFISALASSGRSHLRSLSIRASGISCDRKELQPLWDALLAALPSLPALRRLAVDAPSDALLLGITPVIAPALQRLLLGPWPLRRREYLRCAHAWLHMDAVNHLHAVNPSLQLLARAKLDYYCRGLSPCGVCQLGCHLSLRDSNSIEKYFIFDLLWVIIPRNNPCM
ncbi:uncharacterized protein LOC113211553 [Frankliniella occidentalis]|uniref:Uncharacterized protein LOC113211553 n=1 Tax=Frankliniella occidentalis TaxID=133901 RepID=A0A6J1SWX5_FRAOC|nr:uncharacterized protein LOC113211553 [Frankliniella occidentalis]